MTQITTFRAVMNPGMEHEKIRGFHAVTNAAANAKKLTALLKKLGTVSPPEMPGVNDPVGVLVISTLMWESTTEKAITAYNRLMEQVVDFNDLRVCMPEEIVSVIGARYPKAQERSERLRAMLRNIYLREHAVSMDRLADGGKREAKKYVESLEGIVPYVASRVLLVSFDSHNIPVDEQLRAAMIEADICDESIDVNELANWLSSQIKAGEGVNVHYALQQWVDQRADAPAATERKTSSRKSSTTRKTTRKPRGSSKTTTG